jgi:hypothetical protein
MTRKEAVQRLIDQGGACNGISCGECPINELEICNTLAANVTGESVEVYDAACAMLVADQFPPIDFFCSEMMCEKEPDDEHI